MIEVYKVQIKTITESDKQQILDAVGRAGEEINQRSSVQHIGFHSSPKENSIGFVIADGENITMIGSFDDKSERPDSLDGTTTIYRDKDKFVKISDSGEIAIENNSNKIILKSDGNIEIGGSGLKKLITEDIFTAMNAHTHTGGILTGGLTGPPTYAPPLSTALHATQKVTAQ